MNYVNIQLKHYVFIIYNLVLVKVLITYAKINEIYIFIIIFL